MGLFQTGKIEENNEQLEVIKGGSVFGCLSVAIAGFFVLFGLTGIVSGGLAGLANGVFALIGLIVGAIFAWTSAIRRGVTIDRQREEVRQWWGRLVTLKSDVYDIEEFEQVMLGREYTDKGPGRQGTPDRGGVLVVTLEGPLKIRMMKFFDEDDALEAAERIGSFAGLPYVDATGDRERRFRPKSPKYQIREPEERSKNRANDWADGSE